MLTAIGDYFDWLQARGGRAGRALGFAKSHALQSAASSPKGGFSFLLRRLLRHFEGGVPEPTLLKWVELLMPYRQWGANKSAKAVLAELRRSVRETASDGDQDDEDATAVGPSVDERSQAEEKDRLMGLLRRYTEVLGKPEADSKFNALMDIVASADEPFVVFAQSVDTVYEIKRHVEAQGIPCSLIVGGQDPADRRRIIDGFIGDGRLGRRVLVSSAAGGEGINLQISRRLVHFDLPWNPMVLEQRIGRVHRIGTIDTVVVDTILLEDSREADIYVRLTQRLSQIVNDLREDDRMREQLFRRIMAAIPLETLRELFGGQSDDDAEIASAVDAGSRHVEKVDAELQRHRVAQLPADRGRATMAHLVELLEDSRRIKAARSVAYNTVVYDAESRAFRSERKAVQRFEIQDERSRREGTWVIFDRAAATHAPEVKRTNSGGIDHPVVDVALRSLRTPKDLATYDALALASPIHEGRL